MPLDSNTIVTILAGGLIGSGALIAIAMLTREAAMAARRGARLRGDTIGARNRTAPPSGTVLTSAAAQLVKGAGNIGNRMATRDPAQLTVLRMKLIQAGFNSREAVAVYLGARVTCLGIAVVGSVLLMPVLFAEEGNRLLPLAGIAGLAIGAVVGPDRVVGMRRRERELEYRENFPDVLDLLVASVEAGLSLDAAVSRVADEISRRAPNLAAHIRVLTLELRAGRARKDAWANLAERLGIDEARSFATMLRQAETMGTSVGETLAVFAQEMRTKRMLRAEEKAMALPAKLVVPMILFIFPCLLVTLMLPAGFNVMRQLSGM